MNKKEFLNNLKEKLVENNYPEIDNILEYYDELIEDKKEQNRKEKDVIKSFSNIDNIVKELMIENKIKIANEKPSISNSLKALIAILSIFSLPIILPIGILIFSLFLTIILLLFSLVLVIGSLAFASICSIVAIIAALLLGKIPFMTSIFFIGIVLIITGLSIELIKWSVQITKGFMVWSMDKLKEKWTLRKEKKNE